MSACPACKFVDNSHPSLLRVRRSYHHAYSCVPRTQKFHLAGGLFTYHPLNNLVNVQQHAGRYKMLCLLVLIRLLHLVSPA